MTAQALALVAAAAVVHAGWNALAKAGKDPFAFLWWSVTVASLAFLPVALYTGLSIGDAWPFLATTVAIHAAYFYTLGSAYRRGDLSRVYPIARGLGVALVGVFAWPIFGAAPSPLGAAGIALVAAGVLSFGARRSAGAGWAIATGVLIAGYSIVDSAGVARMHPLPYVTLLGLGTSALLAPIAWRDRAGMAREWRCNRRRIAAAAGLNLTSYLLVLLAFRLSPAGYVVATRELSIVASVVIGWAFLGERPIGPRLARASLIVAGAALCAAA